MPLNGYFIGNNAGIDADDAQFLMLRLMRKTLLITASRGGKAKFGVIGLRDHIGFIFKMVAGGEGAEASFFDTLALACTSTRMVGWKKLPPRSCALPPQTTRAPFSSASADALPLSLSSLFHRSAAHGDALSSGIVDMQFVNPAQRLQSGQTRRPARINGLCRPGLPALRILSQRLSRLCRGRHRQRR